MTKLEKGLKDNCDERGVTGANWRLKVAAINILGQSDYAKVVFKTFPPRCRKGYLYEVTINIVKELIHWDTLSFSTERF